MTAQLRERYFGEIFGDAALHLGARRVIEAVAQDRERARIGIEDQRIEGGTSVGVLQMRGDLADEGFLAPAMRVVARLQRMVAGRSALLAAARTVACQLAIGEMRFIRFVRRNDFAVRLRGKTGDDARAAAIGNQVPRHGAFDHCIDLLSRIETSATPPLSSARDGGAGRAWAPASRLPPRER